MGGSDDPLVANLLIGAPASPLIKLQRAANLLDGGATV